MPPEQSQRPVTPASPASPASDAPPSGATVFVVDDDDAVRDSLALLISSVHLTVAAYATPGELLRAHDPSRPGCLVLDLRMPEMGGLELLHTLRAQGSVLPVLFLTAHGSVPTAVSAIQHGAVDFLEKPVDQQVLLERILHAVALDARSRDQSASRHGILERYRSLTARERDVLERVVAGDANKLIADRLAVSPKTVETHRARVMQKMAAESLADLVRMALEARLIREIPDKIQGFSALTSPRHFPDDGSDGGGGAGGRTGRTGRTGGTGHTASAMGEADEGDGDTAFSGCST